MTDQHNAGRAPKDTGARPPDQPAQDAFYSTQRSDEEPSPERYGAEIPYPRNISSDRGSRTPAGRPAPHPSATSNSAPENPPQSPPARPRPSQPSPVGPYPAGRFPAAAAPNAQERPAVQRPQPDAGSLGGVPPTRPPQRPAVTPPSTIQPPSRLPFWAGFTLSFLLLTVASLGLLILSTGATRFDLASLQGNESAWTPPELVPTPTTDPAQAGELTASNAGDGQYTTGVLLRNVTNTNVRIRQTPGNLSKPDGDVVAGIPAGGQVEVIGGPTSVDGLTWWRVRYTTGNGEVIEGWSAEVTASGLRILGPVQ